MKKLSKISSYYEEIIKENFDNLLVFYWSISSWKWNKWKLNHLIIFQFTRTTKTSFKIAGIESHMWSCVMNQIKFGLELRLSDWFDTINGNYSLVSNQFEKPNISLTWQDQEIDFSQCVCVHSFIFKIITNFLWIWQDSEISISLRMCVCLNWVPYERFFSLVGDTLENPGVST